MEPHDFESDPLKFASLMAHQMQSPLSAISSLLQSVLGEYTGPLQSQQRGALEKADARCEQAITSVRRMLAIIQAQANRDRAAKPASVAAAFRQVHSQFTREAAAHGISLTIPSPSEQVFVQLDEASLTEVLLALVGNALKYTPDHGRVRLTTDVDKTAQRVRLTVSDSGIGIPEELSTKVFDPFFRAPTARDSARPGVGLGLAFVRSIVLSAGGTVDLRRSDLGGSEFILTLPPAENPGTAGGDTGGRAPSLRVVIVGGVTAGPKAAAKIIRLVPDADVTIVERGSIMSYAGCGLPYYVSGLVKDQKRLISSPAGVVRDPVFFSRVKNVHVLNSTEAVEIDRAGQRVLVRQAQGRKESWLPYDKLLLATGASAVVPANLRTDLENVFTLHGVRDAEGIRAALTGSQARDIVIIGGGLIGIEMTHAFVSRGARVTIIERLPHILPILDDDVSSLVEKHLASNGVRVVTGTKALSFQGTDRVSSVVTDDGDYPADMVILAAGVQPNVALARQAELDIGETGAIAVNEHMCTSDPDIYAAGDCVEIKHLLTGRPYYFPLGSTASKQGRIAAVNMCGGDDAFPGVLGSCIFKVFDYAVSRTGLCETGAAALGYDVVTACVPGPDREHFMPNAALLILKLIADRESRRLLGVQAIGPGAADKRIDVAAMALRSKMTVDELAVADLCYGPQFSPAMENLITAANVIRNKLAGYVEGVSAAEVHAMLRDRADFVFLDVRTPEEHEHVRLAGSTLIPLGALRVRAAELPKNKPIVTFCDISLRAYEASLILRAAGFSRVRIMDGGIAMWPFEKME